jgi:hypothetical protein
MRVSSFLALAALLGGCAEGGGDANPSPVDAQDTGPASDSASLDSSSVGDGGREGSLFDAIDDAPCLEGTSVGCTTGCGTPGDATCVAGEYGKCKPKPGDPCSGLDCKGKGDGLEHVYFVDADGDGHGDKSKSVAACEAPAGYATASDDCDDTRSDVYPFAPEKCDLVDNDCNGKCDDGVTCRVGVNRSSRPGEHFYTTSLAEAKCCGFTLEHADAFFLYSGAPAGTTPLYRCIVTSIGKHFYTTDSACEGQTIEGPIGNLAKSATCGAVALMRLANPKDGDHLYTTDPAERTSLAGLGWVDEGTIGYVWL